MNMQLRAALNDPSSSERLQAALDAGTRPDPSFVETLIERCAIEPDFYVREMLTWSLMRHPVSITVPLLVAEIQNHEGQARSQALHSLSKIGDKGGWAAITPQLLLDPDDEVARTAWRAAVNLVPDDKRLWLVDVLAAQLGRGGRDVQQSLSRALAALGDDSHEALAKARSHPSPDVRAHAIATERQIADPDEGFDASLYEARQVVEAVPPPAE